MSDLGIGLGRMIETAETAATAAGPAQFVEAHTAGAGATAVAGTQSVSAALVIFAVAPEIRRCSALGPLGPSGNVLARGAAAPGFWEIDRLPETSFSAPSAEHVVAEGQSASLRMAWGRHKTCRSSLLSAEASSGPTSAGSEVCCTRFAARGAVECSGSTSRRGSEVTILEQACVKVYPTGSGVLVMARSVFVGVAASPALVDQP
jgi:hypothetical protein